MPRKKAAAYSLGFGSAVRDFLGDMTVANYSPDTIESYRIPLGLLERWLPGGSETLLVQVDRDVLQEYFTYLQSRPKRFSTKRSAEKISGAYYETQHRRLHRFFRWCCESRYLKADPMKGFQRPRVETRLVDVVQDDLIQRMLLLTDPEIFHTPSRHFRALRDYAVLLLLVDTPVRRSELANLRVNDLDLDGKSFLVMGKGRKERLQYIGQASLKALRGYLLERAALKPDTDALWVDCEGEVMRKTWLNYMLKRLSARAGFSGNIHPHQFRHSYVLRMVRSDVNLEILRIMGGWTRIPETYLRHLRDPDTRRAHERVAPGDTLIQENAKTKRKGQRAS